MKIENVEKLVANLQDEFGYNIQITNFKQRLKHGLALKRFHGVIKFNQNTCLKPYIAVNTDLRKNAKAKNYFVKNFFKLMNNAVCGKTLENVRKYRDNKLVTTERRSNYFVSEPNYHTTKFLQNIY